MKNRVNLTLLSSNLPHMKVCWLWTHDTKPRHTW